MTGLLTVIYVMAAVAAQDPNASRDTKLIADVQQLSADKLDPALASVPFEKWLQTQAGANARFHWEVNDCGEQSGSPGEKGPVPVCVEVDTTLPDGREIIIFVGNDQPKENRPPEWKLFFAQLVMPHETIKIRRLSELPAALTKTRQPGENPEDSK